jgi:hypothetical protein
MVIAVGVAIGTDNSALRVLAGFAACGFGLGTVVSLVRLRHEVLNSTS